MPSQTPTTFASAAASNGTGDGTSGRNAVGSGDWSRPRMNGSQTFRRSTQINTSVASHTRDTSATVQTPSSAVYVPPHMNSAFARNATSTSDNRYSKDQILDIWKSQSESTHKDISPLLTESWAPGQTAAGNSNWGRRDERDPNPGPEICWDNEGSTKPLSLIDMTEDEKDMRATSVNSLVKPPQPVVKEGAQTPGLNGRKPSISQGTGSLSGRPGVRRRDTTESFGGNPLASPTFQRTENPLASPPPSLMRRRTDLKDAFGSADMGKLDTNVDTKSPFGSLRRTTTNPLSAGLTGPSSPWTAEPQSAGGFGRMGSFGILDQPGTPGEKKPGFGSMGSGSRFLRNLGSKDIDETGKGRAPMNLLDKLAEESNPPSQRQSRAGFRAETDVEGQTGSAALGGDAPSITGQAMPQGSDFPQRQRNQQQNNSLRDDEPSQQYNLTNQTQEPMSPTDTNPYQSPEHERPGVDQPHEEDHESTDDLSQGMGQQMRPNFEASDQGSRPGSTAPPRAMGGLGGFTSGFSSLGGWPGQNQMGQGPPGRSAFSMNDPFGSFAGLDNPGAGGVFSPTGSIGPGTGAFGGPPRSKLGSLFPSQMQDQMRNQDNRQDFFGSIGPSNIPPRDTQSPAARLRNPVDDLFSSNSANRGSAAVSSPFSTFDAPFGQAAGQLASAPGFSTAIGTPGISAHNQPWPAGPSSRRSPDNDSSAMPATQQRTMVMPDRMRWVYKDPSGNVQGPFSGLEMHDWYKAGFFSPELLVRKTEDNEYEPLAQLIRRIGNSREPFLVPQIGIAHGSALGGPGAGVTASSGAPSGNIQPPFANSFPSFGTTLTAEQQNALERRKQEEQYLMAQQKEYLQAKQSMMRNVPFPNGGPSSMHPGPLQHQSSVHSLQSQPSFGSVERGPFQSGQGAGAPLPGHELFGLQRPLGGFGPVGPQQSGPPQHREEDLSSSLDHMILNRASPFAAGLGGIMAQSAGGQQDQNAVNQMLQDRGRLQAQQLEAMYMAQRQPQDPLDGLDRHEEFQRLRQGEQAPVGVIGKPESQSDAQHQQAPDDFVESIEPEEEFQEELQYQDEEPEERLSRPEFVSIPSKDVTEVSTTAPEDVPPVQSAWAAIEKPFAHPIDAPAPSISPLPAPAAQRANQRVAEALAAENRSRSQTPSVETPSSSLAPWAKETTEAASRGPSLKEIQDAEARQAAEREAILAQQRRELAERERLARLAMPEPTPGLPSTASWAASATPASPGASAWAKPAVGGKATPAATKKTLAQIQKEEEARKHKAASAASAAAAAAAAAAAFTTSIASGAATGKRYAELASRPSQTPPSQAAGSGSGAWATVGPSGKAKAPASATLSRAVSGPIPSASPATIKKPAPPSRANTLQTATANANEQVAKWARVSMGRGLNAGISVDEFVRNLMTFPLDVEIIADSIYSSSASLDGRRLAEYFVRQRKLADKGIMPEITSADAGLGSSNASNNGGWSEVAKSKPAPKEESNPGFKVVQKKKPIKK